MPDDRNTLETLSDEDILATGEIGTAVQMDTDADDADVDTDDSDADADLDDPS